MASTMDCNVQSPYCAIRNPEKILIVVISSNRGLCGGFNLNAARLASALILEKYAVQYKKNQVSILSIGKQGDRQMQVAGFKVSQRMNDIWSNFSFDEADAVATDIMERFAQGVYDRVDLVYNEFVNAGFQNPVVHNFLPVVVPHTNGSADGDLTLYEPSKQEIARQLIPRMLRTEFYKAMLDSAAAEHGARMTAMHMATDNATELIGELSLQYNKARQAAITKEILEITAGAEALRG
jgi:F-type H+-transporting ATPase subunit gamma